MKSTEYEKQKTAVRTKRINAENDRLKRQVQEAKNMQEVTGDREILNNLLEKQIRNGQINNYIHWFFHLVLVVVISVLMWQFLQFDTYVYEQDGEGSNYIQEHIEGDINNGAETQKAGTAN